jgi:hypothetical protein
MVYCFVYAVNGPYLKTPWVYYSTPSMYCTTDMDSVPMDMLSAPTDMLGVHMYKSYEDMIQFFITLVPMIHVLLDLTFSYDLAISRKKISSSTFCWHGIKMSQIPLPPIFLI